MSLSMRQNKFLISFTTTTPRSFLTAPAIPAAPAARPDFKISHRGTEDTEKTNTNFKTLNPKQIQMIKIQNVLVIRILNFEFVGERIYLIIRFFILWSANMKRRMAGIRRIKKCITRDILRRPSTSIREIVTACVSGRNCAIS